VPDLKHSPYRWTVAVINWWIMRGDGNSLDEAWANLEKKFEERTLESTPLPRPGTGESPELGFADTTLVEQYQAIAVEFMPKVFGFALEGCFISDESSLSDFPDPDEEYLRKIGIFYGIHPDELENQKLVTIFRLIAQKRGGA